VKISLNDKKWQYGLLSNFTWVQQNRKKLNGKGFLPFSIKEHEN
jgi:hypothetical protein